MKKIIAMCLVVAVALTSFVGCGSKEAATWEDQLGTAGKIRVGMSADYPPFESYGVDADGNLTDEVVGFVVWASDHCTPATSAAAHRKSPGNNSSQTHCRLCKKHHCT